MNVVEHPPEERVHVPELNEPPAPPSLHAIVPVGVVGDPLVSSTSAVKVTVPPVVVEAGFGETAVDVGCGGGVVTVSDEEPELVECAVSPE